MAHQSGKNGGNGGNTTWAKENGYVKRMVMVVINHKVKISQNLHTEEVMVLSKIRVEARNLTRRKFVIIMINRSTL